MTPSSKWNEAVRLAKIHLGKNPDSFTRIQGKLLRHAQIIYHFMLISKKNVGNN